MPTLFAAGLITANFQNMFNQERIEYRVDATKRPPRHFGFSPTRLLPDMAGKAPRWATAGRGPATNSQPIAPHSRPRSPRATPTRREAPAAKPLPLPSSLVSHCRGIGSAGLAERDYVTSQATAHWEILSPGASDIDTATPASTPSTLLYGGVQWSDWKCVVHSGGRGRSASTGGRAIFWRNGR